MAQRKFWIGVGCLVVGILSFLLISGVAFLHDEKLHIYFCDVGQGDGILIKTSDGKLLTIDGGPDESMSTCLATHLPFWIRHIDLMMVTHPHVDHFAGDIALLNHYSVKTFITEDLTSDQQAYQLLLSEVKEKGIPHQILHLGDTYKIGRLSLLTAGPSEELLKRSSPKGQIGESKEFASLLLLLRFGNFSAVLPGDSQAPEMEEGMQTFGIKDITMLQSPHHGSATGVDADVVKALAPKLVAISVGAKNRYHHPAPSTLSLYDSFHIPVKRTDKNGTIEVISDGKSYRVQTVN